MSQTPQFFTLVQLTARIMADHSDYFANDETIRIYQDNAPTVSIFDSHIVVVNDDKSPVELIGDLM